MADAAPRILGRYQIQEELGRGMMGVVYRAIDPALGRTVALKTVNLHLAIPDQDQAAFEQRFLNEARAAAALSHPGIVVVHDVGRDPESASLYIALEYLEGETLADRIRRLGVLEWREALRLCARVAEALHHAHERHIVHRDVKPANIMVLPGGEPKLMDFGIAKVPAAQLTSAGEFFGTPSYMSPEQAAGEALDGRSDLFSLGAVLYVMLTGRRAFDAPSVAAILARVTGKDPAPPSTVAPSVPPVVDDLVARALAKEASARYATGRMMSEDLEDVLAGRDPRHRAGWIPSPRAEDTIRTPAPEPTADLRTPPAREGSLVLRLAERVGGRGVAVLVALLAAGIGLPLVARHSDSLPLTLPLPSLASSVLDPGHLEISFDHPLRSGTLRVYVDDEQVVEEAFTGKVTKKILSFRLRRGSSRQVLDVAPGEHVIRVEVDGAGFEGARRIRGTFKSGETRHLDATVDGIIKRELTLEWGT